MARAPKITQFLDKFDITEAQKRIIITLMDPSSVKLNDMKLCERARTSRNTYYEAFHNINFVECYRMCCIAIAKQHAMPIINKFAELAKTQGLYQQGSDVLEIAGIKDKQKIEIDFRGKLDKITSAKIEHNLKDKFTLMKERKGRVSDKYQRGEYPKGDDRISPRAIRKAVARGKVV